MKISDEVAEIKIDPEFQKLIPPLSADERSLLEDTIIAEGCRDALVVWNGLLLDGHNRLEICKAHDIPFEVIEAPESVKDRTDARIWIRNNQAGRRNLTPAWKIELELGNKEDLLKKGEQVKVETGKQARAKQLGVVSQNDSTPTKKHSTRATIAKSAGVSTGQVGMAEQVRKKAPELWDKAKEGDVSISTAYQQIKRKEKEEQREARREQNAGLVKDKNIFETIQDISARFATIMIDPPWDWGDENDVDQMGRAKPTYQTLSFDKLLALPVGHISDVDCHLYLWITNRSLPKGFKLIEQWGFRYITCITWVKPSFGMGNYFRGATEHILFGVRGSQPLKRKDAPTYFNAKRGIGGHSSKPEESYKLIESCSPGPYAELFSRGNREGWVSVGAES